MNKKQFTLAIAGLSVLGPSAYRLSATSAIEAPSQAASERQDTELDSKEHPHGLDYSTVDHTESKKV